ncbi:MAG: type II secretion system F family protein [Planctomycetaceae bacterium]|nr:type II secretion system F family protein [Planctomycetaceae bacterium]
MQFTNVEMYISILVFLAVVLIGGSVIMLRAQRRRQIELRMLGTFEDDPFQQKEQEAAGFLKLLVKVGNFTSHGKASASLWEQMIQAGFLHPYAPAVYTGIKIVMFIIGFIICLVLVLPTNLMFSTQMSILFIGATVSFFLPNVFLYYKLKQRQREIYRHLPEAVDLLEICVSSGLGLDMAWNIVADEIRQVSPVLAGSMSLTNFEMHLGISRIEAMKHMAERTGVDELKSLAAILIQTDRFGTSIAETLKVFAQSIREERSFVAQEAAEKMSVQMIIPLVLFIFPAVLITMVGPAIISIARNL